MMNKRFPIILILTLLTFGVNLYNLAPRDNDYLFSPSVAEASAIISDDISTTFPDSHVQSVLLKTVTEKIHPSLPEYTFAMYGHEAKGGYSISKIVITQASSPISQELTFPDTFTPDRMNFGFFIEDLNFDGYKDLRIQEFLPASPNVPYLYWTFDPATKKFLQNNELTMISSPIIDHQNQMILSYTRSSASIHTKNFYQYIDDHITLLKAIELRADPANQVAHITVKELKNGILIETNYDKPLPVNNFDEIE